MAQVILYGTDASITTTSPGYGNHYNYFSVNVSQGVTEAYGFGDSWMSRRGTIKSVSGEISGFLTKGTTADQPGTAAMTRVGADIMFTFSSMCTMHLTGILTGLAIGVSFLGTDTGGYSYVSDGSLSESWVTT